jgi:nicotinamidase/pyrazinamidase
MNALVLVDLQNDFCPGGALAVPHGDEVVAVANALLRSGRFARVVATQDWHPIDHGSFAANHPGRAPYELGELAGLPQVLWPAHCVQGTHGAAFHADLDTARIDRVFPKGTDAAIDSYSGFFDNGKRKSTGLGEWLRAEGVRELTVLGLATDYCVKATALDARALGFAVTLVEEGCRGVGLGATDVADALAAMRAAEVRIVSADGAIG